MVAAIGVAAYRRGRARGGGAEDSFTMWTNVFQGLMFLVFTLVAFVLIGGALGGFSAATQAVLDVDPTLLIKGDRPVFQPASFSSWALATSPVFGVQPVAWGLAAAIVAAVLFARRR